MTELVLGIDCSTTSAKCIAWDRDGREVASGRASFGLSNPAPSGYEQDALQWWEATVSAIAQTTNGVDPARIVGVCITHQRETFVVTDEDGCPRGPAIVWMDERARAQVAQVRRSGRAEAIHRQTGKPVSLTPSIYKIMWQRAGAEHLYAPDDGRGVRVVDVHAFLVKRLTGVWRTSTASADPMGLVDMASRAWSAPMLALARLDERHVPELAEPGALLGEILPQVAERCGLRPGTPVFAGAGDGQAAGLGAGVTGPSEAYLNLGTAVVSGVGSASYLTSEAFRTLFGGVPGQFFLETDLKGGTFTLNWLVQKMMERPGAPAQTLDALQARAAALPPGAQGLMLVPYWCGVMNPFWDDDASGVMVGLRGHHGPAHVYRAVLEGIAFEQRLHTEGVQEATGVPIESFVAMGGGARSAMWRQIMADVTGRPVIQAGHSEATALGAGILAAASAGLHPSVQAATVAMTRRGPVTAPGDDQARYNRLYREVYVDLFPGVRRAMARLTALSEADG